MELEDVNNVVIEVVAKAERLFSKEFDLPLVRFSCDMIRIGGKCFYRKERKAELRFNTNLMENETFENTVIHEVSHYIEYAHYGTTGHGVNWRNIFVALGGNGKRCHSYELKGNKVFTYACDCKEHKLTIIKHNRIQRRETFYKCKSCKGRLKLKETE